MSDSITRTLLKNELEKRNCKVTYLGQKEQLMVVMMDDGTWNIFEGSRPKQSHTYGRTIACNKFMSLEFARNVCGLKVPDYALYENADQAVRFLNKNGKIVVKPNDLEQSKGVTAGIKSEDELKAAIADALQWSDEIILQKHVDGELYRVFVLNGKVVAVSNRKKTYVTGDGVKTVDELIDETNRNPLRGSNDRSPMKQIKKDSVIDLYGEDILNKVLEKGEELALSKLPSVSAGGEALDATDEMHESYRTMSEDIASKLGLFVCGFDIIAQNIKEGATGCYPLLEINSMPGLKIHHFPARGKPRNLAKMIIDEVFKK